VILVEMENYLAITPGVEVMPPFDQPTAQLAVVVDLAIGNQYQRMIFIVERLASADEVDDAQPPHPKLEPAIRIPATTIGTTVNKGRDHAIDIPSSALTAAADLSCYSTHLIASVSFLGSVEPGSRTPGSPGFLPQPVEWNRQPKLSSQPVGQIPHRRISDES
jgi:hypothetical protein